MKSFLIFLAKGLPLSIPISLLGFAGTSGGMGAMPWIAMAVGLPWDIPGLFVIAATILSHGTDKILATFLLWSGIVWTFISITINCSILIVLLQKIPSPHSSGRNNDKEAT
jgi:hypothetical protein